MLPARGLIDRVWAQRTSPSAPTTPSVSASAIGRLFVVSHDLECFQLSSKTWISRMTVPGTALSTVRSHQARADVLSGHRRSTTTSSKPSSSGTRICSRPSAVVPMIAPEMVGACVSSMFRG